MSVWFDVRLEADDESVGFIFHGLLIGLTTTVLVNGSADIDLIKGGMETYAVTTNPILTRDRRPAAGVVDIPNACLLVMPAYRDLRLRHIATVSGPVRADRGSPAESS